MNIFETLYDQTVTEAHESQYDTTGVAFQKGNAAEEFFSKVAHFNGYAFQEGTSIQDRQHHIDGSLFSPFSNKKYDIEIKSQKADCGGQNLLIELRSRGGVTVPGWLYGRAHFIAFMYEYTSQPFPYHPNMFILINRPILQNITEKMTNTKWVVDARGMKQFVFDEKQLVHTTCDAVAPKLYHRTINDPSSVITRIPISTLLNQLQKDKDYFLLKFVESKNVRDLKSRQENLEIYKTKTL
jgi:hypothetical protein